MASRLLLIILVLAKIFKIMAMFHLAGRSPITRCLEITAYQSGLGPLSAVPIASAFLPLVNLPEAELHELLAKHLDSVEYQRGVLSQQEQFKILRESLANPDNASGQYTMAPFQIVPKAGPACKGIYGMGEDGNYIGIVSVLNHPFSRGFVHINSTKATDEPTTDPRYFSHPLDLELHARHTQYLETLAATEPMASLLRKGGRRLHGNKIETLEGAKESVRELLISH